jgi:hypothetical protein
VGAGGRGPMTRGRWLVVVGGAAAVIGIGIALAAGGGDETASGDASTTTATVAPADAPFCDAFGALLVGPLADPATDASDPALLQEAVELTDVLLAVLEETAPPEVEASAVALATQYRAAFEVFARYGYVLERVAAEATPEEQAALDAFGQAPIGPGAPDPFRELEGFVADRCAPGITVPPELLTTLPPATNP